MNQSFGVKLEGNRRPRGTERGGLSPDARCLSIATTGPLSCTLAAAVPLPACCPFTVPYPCAASGRSKTVGSGGCQQEHLLCVPAWCPSSLERPGCVKTACVCVWNCVTDHFPVTFWSLWQVERAKTFDTRTCSGRYVVFTAGTQTHLQVSWCAPSRRNHSCYCIHLKTNTHSRQTHLCYLIMLSLTS